MTWGGIRVRASQTASVFCGGVATGGGEEASAVPGPLGCAWRHTTTETSAPRTVCWTVDVKPLTEAAPDRKLQKQLMAVRKTVPWLELETKCNCNINNS